MEEGQIGAVFLSPCLHKKEGKSLTAEVGKWDFERWLLTPTFPPTIKTWDKNQWIGVKMGTQNPSQKLCTKNGT